MKFSSFVYCTLFSVGALSCASREHSEGGKESAGSEVAQFQKGMTVADALKKKMVVKVNIRSSVGVLFQNGKAVSKWKLATAANSAQLKNQRGSLPNPANGSALNPVGVFAVHALQDCPRHAAKGASQAPCASNNPLGRAALWFQGNREFGEFEFGLHGIDVIPAKLQSVGSESVAERRKSLGCIRNHPNNINSLINLAKNTGSYKEASRSGAEITYRLKDNTSEPVYVVINWDTEPDPDVPDVSGKPSLIPTAPKEMKFPATCNIDMDLDSGFLNIRPKASTGADSVPIATGREPDEIKVTGKVTGESVNGNSTWFNVEFDGKTGFAHSSGIDCP